MNKRVVFYTMCAIAISCIFSLSAVFADSGILWTDLSPTEREILKPLKKTWDQLPLKRQKRMKAGAKRWETLTPSQRKQAAEQLRLWKTLPQKRKERVRQRFDYFQSLSEEDRSFFLIQKNRFKDLPEARRRELREQWKKLSPEKRSEIRGLLGIDRKNGDSPDRLEHRMKNQSDRRSIKNRLDRREREKRLR